MVDNSNISLSFEPPMWMYHVSGGLSLLVGSNRLAMLLVPGQLISLSILPTGSPFSLLEKQVGLRTIGQSRFNAAEEMRDPVASNFTISALTPNRECLAYTQSFFWSGIAVALHAAGQGTNALTARRVHSQIHLCRARLEKLSFAYRTVLSIVGPTGQVSAGDSFSLTSDKYAHHIGSEYRSLLNELYSLRDALLSLAFRLRYHRDEPFQTRRLKSLVKEDAGAAGRLIDSSMFSADGDRLIDRMSLYRAIAQHCLGATNPVIGDVYLLNYSEGPFGKFPFLIYPLYDDIEAMRGIEQGSSKGVIDQPSKAEAERFMQVSPQLDALEFCYDCFIRLLKISEAISADIAIVPQSHTIADKDILEMAVTNEDGTVDRFKKDIETGELCKVTEP